MVHHGTIGLNIGSNDDEDDDGDDDDDGAIDWEEGEPNSNSRTTDDSTTHTAASTVSHHQKTQQHLSAVERTIATMQATGTREELEVDFDAGRRKRPRRSNDGGDNLDDCDDNDHDDDDDDDNVHEEYNNETMTTTVRTKQAEAKVQRIIQKLATRHLLRLSAWLDGLRNSDGLVLLPRDTSTDTTTTTITNASSSSLVALSAQQQEHRLFLIQKFAGLKDEMTRLMASVASHLQIYAHHAMVAVAATNPSHTPVHRVLIHKKKQMQKGRRTHRHQHGTTPHKRKIKILLQK